MKAACSGSILANCLPMPCVLCAATKPKPSRDEDKTLTWREYRFEHILYAGIITTMKGQPVAPALSLSAFLRALRERQSPAEFGLAGGSRRRTPGLRREEVAQLCGLSVTWYTWIEQGRDVSVSATTLARLARGLRLSRAERSYLFEVAGKRDPQRPANRDDPPEAVLACVDAI